MGPSSRRRPARSRWCRRATTRGATRDARSCSSTRASPRRAASASSPRGPHRKSRAGPRRRQNSGMRAETVIATHTNADFDALASMLAVRRLYPGAVVALPGSLARNVREFYRLHADELDVAETARLELDAIGRLGVVATLPAPPARGPPGSPAPSQGPA